LAMTGIQNSLGLRYLKRTSRMGASSSSNAGTESVEGTGPDSLQYRIQAKDSIANLSAFSDVVSMRYDRANQKRNLTQQPGEVPEKYELFEAFPNPFNPSTQIEYGLPQPGFVSVIVYDGLGREIVTLTKRYENAGYHFVRWEGGNGTGSAVSSEMYFVSLTVRDELGGIVFSQTNKVLLMR